MELLAFVAFRFRCSYCFLFMNSLRRALSEPSLSGRLEFPQLPVPSWELGPVVVGWWTSVATAPTAPLLVVELEVDPVALAVMDSAAEVL
jgi:hypothetical protein